MTKIENNYDLAARTMDLSQNLILFLKSCPKTSLAIPLIDQCLRAGTSIGANYREANGGSSRKDFFNKILRQDPSIDQTKFPTDPGQRYKAWEKTVRTPWPISVLAARTRMVPWAVA